MELFKISNLIVGIDTKGIKLQKELGSFRVDASSDIKCDIEIDLDISGNNLNFLQHPSYDNGKLIFKNYFLCIYEETDCFYVTYFGATLLYGFKVNKYEPKAVIYMENIHHEVYDTVNVKLSDDPNIKKTGPEFFVYAIRDAYLFHALLNNQIAVHSSSLIYKNKVWMFLAPSGTGKTTHINMWKKSGTECADFNGDIATIYYKDTIPYAGALPWSGTSEIFTNTDYPLGGIFILKQGDTDSVKRLGLEDATLSISARCLTPNWTRELLNKNIDIAMSLVKSVPVWELICTPTVNAAVVTKEAIDDYLNSL